jgi:hypothetical protein
VLDEVILHHNRSEMSLAEPFNQRRSASRRTRQSISETWRQLATTGTGGDPRAVLFLGAGRASVSPVPIRPFLRLVEAENKTVDLFVS